MSGNIFECSVKHNDFNTCQERLQSAQRSILPLVSSFAGAVKNQDDLSMGLVFAALSRNNQYILNDIARSDTLLEAVDEHYKEISNADVTCLDVWKQGGGMKVKFDEMRAEYEEGRDDMLQRAEHMKISYDQLMILMKDGGRVSAEDFDAVHQDLKASILEA